MKFDLYALSIFAPPLYIGKTNNLNRRYNEHLKNTEQSKFKERFELHTKDMGIQIKDLIFACVILDKAIDNVEYSRTIEGLINKLFKPIYGVR